MVNKFLTEMDAWDWHTIADLESLCRRPFNYICGQTNPAATKRNVIPVTVYPNVVFPALPRIDGPLPLSEVVVLGTLLIEKLFAVVEGGSGNDVYGGLVFMVGVEELVGKYLEVLVVVGKYLEVLVVGKGGGGRVDRHSGLL